MARHVVRATTPDADRMDSTLRPRTKPITADYAAAFRRPRWLLEFAIYSVVVILTFWLLLDVILGWDFPLLGLSSLAVGFGGALGHAAHREADRRESQRP
jgi:hypothetical protein